MFPRFDSSSHAQRAPGPSISSKGSSRQGSRATSAQLSTSTVKYNPLSTGPNWHLPSDWNWTGDRSGSKDVVFRSKSEFPGQEWSASSGSAVLGHSNAVVTRVVCQGKVLARKSVKVSRRNPTLHLNEMKILKVLNHQHIIQLCGTYSVGTNFHTLVYPVAEMNLQDFMHQGGKDDSPNWVRTLTNGMGCLINALAYIHGAGIKHKDIKPSNILVLGDVMIFSDFGSASDIRDRSDGSKSWSLIGMTRMYAPPEAINGEEHGRSADIFSLGLVMSEMIEYIFYPSGPSSVERRLREMDDGKRESASFNPAAMTRDEEDFLHYMPRAERAITQEDMQFLFKVMTARDPKRRPTAKEVWAFLRGRYFDLVVGDGGVCATCGKCCL